MEKTAIFKPLAWLLALSWAAAPAQAQDFQADYKFLVAQQAQRPAEQWRGKLEVIQEKGGKREIVNSAAIEFYRQGQNYYYRTGQSETLLANGWISTIHHEERVIMLQKLKTSQKSALPLAQLDTILRRTAEQFVHQASPNSGRAYIWRAEGSVLPSELAEVRLELDDDRRYLRRMEQKMAPEEGVTYRVVFRVETWGEEPAPSALALAKPRWLEWLPAGPQVKPDYHRYQVLVDRDGKGFQAGQ